MDLGCIGLYYLCSEKKDADQLHSYRAADLPLCKNFSQDAARVFDVYMYICFVIVQYVVSTEQFIARFL